MASNMIADVMNSHGLYQRLLDEAGEEMVDPVTQVRWRGIGPQSNDVGVAEGELLLDDVPARIALGKMGLHLVPKRRRKLPVHVRKNLGLHRVAVHGVPRVA